MSKYCDQLTELEEKLRPYKEDKQKDLNYFVDQIYFKYFEQLLSDRRFGIEFNAREFSNIKKPDNESDNDVWIFGYGSLIWKVEFPYLNRARGYICCVQRKFYQNSVDHRGTLEKPGRVVTLLAIEDSNYRVYGIAYRLAASQKQDVLRHLDYREKNGYKQRSFTFHEIDDNDSVQTKKTFDVILYIASEQNESFASKENDLLSIASIIQTSTGSSGPNRDYVFNLATAMRHLFPGIHDDHLFDIEKFLLQGIKQDELPKLQLLVQQKIRLILLGIEEGNSLENAIKCLELLKDICSKCDWQASISMNELS